MALARSCFPSYFYPSPRYFYIFHHSATYWALGTLIMTAFFNRTVSDLSKSNNALDICNYMIVLRFWTFCLVYMVIKHECVYAGNSGLSLARTISEP